MDGVKISEILKNLGISYINDRARRSNTLQVHNVQLKGMEEVRNKAIACNNRIAPYAIQEAVAKALDALGVGGVTPSKGDYIRAQLSQDDVVTIKRVLGAKLVTTKTISAFSAESVDLDSTWELKIYKVKASDTSFGVCVGYKADSWAHFFDAIDYALSEKANLNRFVVPNGANAETYLDRYFYDAISVNALNQFKMLGYKIPAPFDKVLGEKLGEDQIKSIPAQ